MDEILRSLHGGPAMAIGLTLGALIYIVFFAKHPSRDD